jgi:hypothetical protein
VRLPRERERNSYGSNWILPYYRLASCIASSPHAALAAATRFVHTAWRDDGAGAGGEAGADGKPETAAARGCGESCGRLVPRDSDYTAAWVGHGVFRVNDFLLLRMLRGPRSPHTRRAPRPCHRRTHRAWSSPAGLR